MSAAVWGDPMSIGIVPFERLNVRLPRPASGRSFRCRQPARSSTLAAGGAGLARARRRRGKTLWHALAGRKPISNRDPSKLTVLVNTGVTAIARGGAAAPSNESGDDAYVARVVGPELAAADITTINNEIPFMEGCKLNTDPDNIIFCSDPAYFEALKLSGTTLVGLTGNHMNDFGTAVFSDTLDFYDRQGIHTYGGGRNAAATRAPLVVEHNGNTFGFLGANQVARSCARRAPTNGERLGWDRTRRAPLGSTAGRWSPISRRCGRRSRLSTWRRCSTPSSTTTANTRRRRSPSKWPTSGRSAMRAPISWSACKRTRRRPWSCVADNRIILYGLGNLYFDQVRNWATRPGLVARNAIYDGRLLNTRLLVTVIDLNMRPALGDGSERIQVLERGLRGQPVVRVKHGQEGRRKEVTQCCIAF